ncbi:MAG: tetratricopeptide repeat protein [Gemmatimonadales bacterium]|nr:tetratricopeptide repeat protein [Gemmatimonadales bacterium]
MAGPYLQLGSLDAASGQYDHALARVGKAIEVNPRNIGALMLAGVIHERRGDHPKAREHYEKVPALNPRFPPAADNLAWILSEHGGDKDKALTLAQTAKELAPEDPRAVHLAGVEIFARGKRAEGRSELDPRLAGPYLQLGGLHAASGQFDQALAKVRQALEGNPKKVSAVRPGREQPGLGPRGAGRGHGQGAGSRPDGEGAGAGRSACLRHPRLDPPPARPAPARAGPAQGQPRAARLRQPAGPVPPRHGVSTQLGEKEAARQALGIAWNRRGQLSLCGMLWQVLETARQIPNHTPHDP